MTNNTAIGTKKSDFIEQTTIPNDGTLDFVSSGQNIKITYANFLSGLGVTGTIVQDGDPAGTPILDVQGSVNNIRNLEPGPGVTVGVSAMNGAQISSSYTFDSTGAQLVDDPLLLAPEFKSLVAGTDISITDATQTITINANTDGLRPDNRIIINQASDFPSAVGGRIPLADNTEYYIGGDITVTDPFSVGENVVINGRRPISSITYTGTDPLFLGTDCKFFVMSELVITCANANIGDFTDTTTQSIIVFENSVFTCVKGCVLDDVLSFIFRFSNGICTDALVEFNGTATQLISISRVAAVTTNTSFIGIDFGSNVFNTIEVFNFIVDGVSGAIGISGLASSGNISSGKIGSITSCEFLNNVTPLSGITADDFRYSFSAVSGIPDTRQRGILSLSTNATLTTITTINTPVLVTGTWIVQNTSHFTGSAAGRLTYIGERDYNGSITVTMALEPDSGTNKDMTAYIALNGTVIGASGIQVRGDSGDARTATLIWQQNLQENDYIETFVENNTDTIDILVENSVLRIN